MGREPSVFLPGSLKDKIRCGKLTLFNIQTITTNGKNCFKLPPVSISHSSMPKDQLR